MLAYVRQLSRNRDVAEDLVQEVFVAVWRRAASYPRRPGRSRRLAVYRSPATSWWTCWRRTGERADLDVRARSSERRLAEPERPGDLRLISVRQALSRVAPEQRRAIEMAYFGGFTYEETARRLDLPLGTLKSRIRSGLKTLRSLLENRMEAR